MSGLVLSLFPGIGLLDRGFEEHGFCVVRGPDLLWGGDVKRFHPPAGRFDGVIGGTPCQRFSALAGVIKAVHGEEALAPDCIPDFERVIEEAQPSWFVMENVERAPLPCVAGYKVHGALLNARWLGELQNRLHRFSFGTRDGRKLGFRTEPFEPIYFEPRVCTNSGGRRAKLVYDATGRPRGKQGHADEKRLRGRSIERMCELQGLPAQYFAHSPFTKTAQEKMLGNGVPLAMARELARAVLEAIDPSIARIAS